MRILEGAGRQSNRLTGLDLGFYLLLYKNNAALLTGVHFHFCCHRHVVVIIYKLVDASIFTFQIRDLKAVKSEVQSSTINSYQYFIFWFCLRLKSHRPWPSLKSVIDKQQWSHISFQLLKLGYREKIKSLWECFTRPGTVRTLTSTYHLLQWEVSSRSKCCPFFWGCSNHCQPEWGLVSSQ